MDTPIVKFWSKLVLALSEPITQVLKQAFIQIKYRSVNRNIRRMEKIDFQSVKKSEGSSQNYMSISDFKPLSNQYSSVKIHEDDEKVTEFQTKRQQIMQTFEETHKKHCKLEDWMIARKAKLILPENYPKSQFCSKSITSYSPQALDTIKTYKFDEFCERNVKKKKSMFFFEDKKIMKYKTDSLSDSLSNLADTKVQNSIDIFDILLTAGGQKQGAYPTVVYVWKFISQIFEEMEDMKQQAYLQVIKQITSNLQIYYQILACLSATVQPSTRMFLPLLNYIYTHTLDPDAIGFEEYHSYIFYSLIENFNRPRKAPPSLFEVFCLMNLRKIPLLISFPRENIFYIESYSTVEQILEEQKKLYGLADYQYLINIEGVLLQKGNILDGLNQSRLEQQQEQWISRFTHFKGYRAFIVIKNMMEMYSCQQNFLIMFNYLVNQYRRGLFAVSNKTAFEIGGLIITSEVEMEECYEFSLAKYLPRKKYENGISEYKLKNIENMIIKQYESFKGTKNDARQKIIEKLSKSRAFLTHFFLCNVFIDQQQFTQAWVGLKTESMIVVEPYSNRLLTQFEYEKIKRWGSSASQLCLKVDTLGEFHIESRKLDTLVSIFSCYLKFLKQQVKKAGKLKPTKKEKKRKK